MPNQLTDTEIAMRIVPTLMRWPRPEIAKTIAWDRLREAVDLLHGLVRAVGAEIVRTVVVGASEIELLLLVIASRGLFSLILYLERRWHGTTETE